VKSRLQVRLLVDHVESEIHPTLDIILNWNAGLTK
jgi:hypothetical protein